MRVSILIALGGLLFGTPLIAQNAQSRLWDAAMAGDTLAIRQALADGADIDALDMRSNPNGRRALNWAAWYDHVPAIEILLAAGATLEAENNTGFSPLHHAAEAGSVAAAQALLAAGADPGHANKAGRLPIETAHGRGNGDVAALLAAASAEQTDP